MGQPRTVAKTAVPRPERPWDTPLECPRRPSSPWAADFARLHPDRPPQGFSPRRWRDTLRDGELFLATWAMQAHELGWAELDLFGAHRIAPEARWDCAGLVLLIGGGRIVAMTASTAAIQRPSGSRLTYTRVPANAEALPLWALSR